MIFVTKLNGEIYLLNDRLVETAEEKPDTTLTLTGGKILIVKESLEELQKKIIDFESNIKDIRQMKSDKK